MQAGSTGDHMQVRAAGAVATDGFRLYSASRGKGSGLKPVDGIDESCRVIASII
jgi:hypothetical protein